MESITTVTSDVTVVRLDSAPTQILLLVSLGGNEAVQSTKEMAKNSVYNPLNQLTNAYTVRDRPTLKAVERFRNGSVRELIERVTHFTSGFIESHSLYEWIYRETYRETYRELKQKLYTI